MTFKDVPQDEIREMTMQEGDVLSLGSIVLAELGASLESRERS